jgi:hypothetical protein
VCGFQTIFIMIHLPAYLLDRGATAVDGMTALAIIGLANIAGSFLAGSRATATARSTCSARSTGPGRSRSPAS